jgi:predicted ABC-type ATPase
MRGDSPELWLIAGPNGAGKTTFSQQKPLSDLLGHVVLVNPDDVALQILQQQGYSSFHDPDSGTLRSAFLNAAARSLDDVEQRLTRNEAVAAETVLSTTKYQPAVTLVRERAGFFALIYIALASPELACERVLRRHALGGHDVPQEKIRDRWRRSLELLPTFAAQADLLLVYDNSNEEPDVPPVLIATGRDGDVVLHEADANPEVVAALQELRQ